MFESLTERLQQTFKKLRGQGVLTEKNVSDALREVRRTLMEADVNVIVVKQFIDNVKTRALGQEVLGSLTPELQMVRIIREELTALMGEETVPLQIAPSGPTSVMLVGLQGSGKTTAAGKLARLYQKQGRNPMLVAADVYRPAAIEQLRILGEQLEIPVFSMGDQVSPVDIARAAMKQALKQGHDFVVIDTAGRLQINEELMEELARIKASIQPTEILFVANVMIGSEVVNVAKTFDEILDLSGVILTMLDGDARGGAALSIRSVTQKPIKFAGTGEGLDALEVFHPDRMSNRIIGQGDLMTLMEKAEQVVDEDTAKELEQKILEKKGLDLNDLMDQLKSLQKMGPLEQLVDMIPGAQKLKGLQVDENQIKRVEAIIQSMTPEERTNYKILNGSRKLRVAKGSGTTVRQVNEILDQLRMMNRFIKQQIGGPAPRASKKGKGKRRRRRRPVLPLR